MAIKLDFYVLLLSQVGRREWLKFKGWISNDVITKFLYVGWYFPSHWAKSDKIILCKSLNIHYSNKIFINENLSDPEVRVFLFRWLDLRLLIEIGMNILKLPSNVESSME